MRTWIRDPESWDTFGATDDFEVNESKDVNFHPQGHQFGPTLDDDGDDGKVDVDVYFNVDVDVSVDDNDDDFDDDSDGDDDDDLTMMMLMTMMMMLMHIKRCKDPSRETPTRSRFSGR